VIFPTREQDAFAMQKAHEFGSVETRMRPVGYMVLGAPAEGEREEIWMVYRDDREPRLVWSRSKEE
jgi:hypothetical protein